MSRVPRLCTCLAGVLSAGLMLSAAPAVPKLAVLIVVDQMRADYVARFQAEWTSGLRRLVTQGAWLTRAAYPYLTTVTCSGHATIATGAFPNTHGIFQNVWFDRPSQQAVTCTQDPSAATVSYGKPSPGGDSAAALRIPTFADEMRRQRRSRVVSLSLKPTAAVMLAGHGGDAVSWLLEDAEGWQTSTAFTSQPVPAVRAYLSEHPIEADYGRTWNRLFPQGRYPERDSGLGEAPPAGWTSSFPHVLTGVANGDTPDKAFYEQWERSPFADEYLGRMAAALTQSMSLGSASVTDVLALSFSAPDHVGHAFGPGSQEVHDLFLRLDRTIGALLDRLDALVGRNQYVVALSADHGVSMIPEQLREEGRDGGRLSSSEVAKVIEQTAQSAAGPGRYVARANGNDIYFEPGMFERLADAPTALNRVVAAMSAIPGVGRVFRGTELPAATRSSDPLRRAAALSYVAGRSGDLIIAPKSGWIFAAAGATHGTSNAGDQHVPLIFYGVGIRPGRYDEPVTPADIAPTLAEIFGISMPRAEGRPIRAILTAASNRPRGPRP